MGISHLMKAAFPIGFISMAPSSSSSSVSADNSTGTAKSVLPPSAINQGNDTYKMYAGDGGDGWPAMEDWVDFYSMWEQNEVMINKSCDALGYSGVPNPTSEELDGILDAISAESKESGLDERFLLAVIMQESKGCVRAKSTASPGDEIRNPGLMQTHNGIGSCNEEGDMQEPCPDSTIKQMIKDGVSGTDHGDGLKQTYEKAKGSGAAQYYRASRMYNGGSIVESGNLGEGCCTKCYASDIANRLTGWVTANHNCDLDGETGWSPMAHIDGSASQSTDSTTTPSAPAAADAVTAPEAGKSTQWDGDDGMWHGNEGSWNNGQWADSKAATAGSAAGSASGAAADTWSAAGSTSGAAGSAAGTAGSAAGAATQW